jgi:purine-nucleoside/S-methyl-5'-thioadenosine phosphorylase / adenosine deaminase
VAVVLERRELPGGPSALVATEFEDAGFLAAFTERTGGVSDGPFQSLNLGLATDDHAANVFENRRRLAAAFELDRIAALRQVHGAAVINVGSEDDRRWEGFESLRRDLPAGDALATSAIGLGLIVLTADCVPVALADPRTGLMVVVHAGWRGVAGGAIRTAVDSFPDASGIIAAVGPAIGPDHYPVGRDVVAAVAAASPGGAVVQGNGDRPLLDLPGTIHRMLVDSGVTRVESAALCTACHPERFFSYRRDRATGRQALIGARLS